MKKLIYCEYSETIRQTPENYMLANRRNGKWYAGGYDTDGALNKTWAKIRMYVFLLTHWGLK